MNSVDVLIKGCRGGNWAINILETRTSSRILVTNNIFEQRIEVYDSTDYISFIGNVFYNLHLVTGTDTGNTINGLQIIGNLFYGVTSSVGGGNHVAIQRSQNVLIANNIIESTSPVGMVIASTCSHVDIKNNQISASDNVMYMRGSFVSIMGNRITQTAGFSSVALYLDSGSPQNVNIQNNTFVVDTVSSSNGVAVLSSGGNIEIIDNQFLSHNNATYVGSGITGVAIRRNKFTSCTTGIFDIGTGTIKEWNDGYATENSSSTTITSGNTHVDVSHGLDAQPATSTISIIPANNLGNASSTSYWVSDVGASTFRINVGVDPGATGADFSWQVGSY